jgi:four helix bundle protein
MSDKLPPSAAPGTPKPRSYRDLLVWQKGIELARRIYDVTSKLPADERFGLISQIRRAAVSVPSNIAEGQARRTTSEFIQFISYAEGSLAELDTHLVLIVELGLLTEAQVSPPSQLVAELRAMLNSLRRKLGGRS